MTSTHVEQQQERPRLRVVADPPSAEPPEASAVAADAATTDRTPTEKPAASTPVTPVDQPEATESAPNARNVHARARETSARFRSGAVRLLRSRPVTYAVGLVRPPDLWRRDQPSLRAVWRHAIWGEHVPDGAARFAYVIAWLAVCAVPVTTAYIVGWWHARPARVLVGWALAWAAYRLPYVHDAINIVLAWVTLPMHLTGIGG